MSRKTIAVDQVRQWVNERLAFSDSVFHSTVHDMTPEQAFRLGVASLYEQIAQATGNYKGFTYQGSEFLFQHSGDNATPLRPGYDESRRFYFGTQRKGGRRDAGSRVV